MQTNSDIGVGKGNLSVDPDVRKADGEEGLLFMFNKLKYLLILLIVIIVSSGISGWFYWFQWKPSEVRKQCNEERNDYLNSELSKIRDGESEFIVEPLNITEYRENLSQIKVEARKSAREEAQRVYERCLNSRGIK